MAPGRIVLPESCQRNFAVPVTSPWTSCFPLGNMPEKGQEHLYEKVAFLGQIPIKVLGPVQQGDYIIPSGLEDGSGIAVAPVMMTADEFTRVVGRAWSASNETGLKLVNVAIGLNTGDVAMLVHKQEAELAVFKAALAQQDEEMRTLRAEVDDLQAVARDVQRLNAAMAKLVASAPEAAPRGMTIAAAGDRN